jgi:hypothetical protein
MICFLEKLGSIVRDKFCYMCYFWESLSILILIFKCFVSIKNVKKMCLKFCLQSMCDAAFCYRI